MITTIESIKIFCITRIYNYDEELLALKNSRKCYPSKRNKEQYLIGRKNMLDDVLDELNIISKNKYSFTDRIIILFRGRL